MAALGNIVEIGSYKGRSTWYLARGLQERRLAVPRAFPLDRLTPPRSNAPTTSPTSSGTDSRTGSSRASTSRTTLVQIVRCARGDALDRRRPQLSRRATRLRRLVSPPPAPGLVCDARHGQRLVWADAARTRATRSPGGSRLIGVVWLTLFARKVPDRASARARGIAARAMFELLTLAQARRSGFGPQTAAAGER